MSHETVMVTVPKDKKENKEETYKELPTKMTENHKVYQW